MPAPSVPYTPAQGSLPDRVCKFFRIHPDEELTTGDIARKFDAPTANVTNGLQLCLTHGLLNRVRSEGELVWVAGPKLQQTPPPSAATATATPKTRRTLAPLPPIDVATLQVRNDVALPAVNFGRPPKGHTKYDALFDALKKVGASVEFPRTHRGAISAAKESYAKRTGRKFTVRTVNPTTCGIWRTA